MNMQSHCRPDCNWYALRWGIQQTYNPYTPISAYTIRTYVHMDQGVF
jgi:hypothetical protein